MRRPTPPLFPILSIVIWALCALVCLGMAGWAVLALRSAPSGLAELHVAVLCAAYLTCLYILARAADRVVGAIRDIATAR